MSENDTAMPTHQPPAFIVIDSTGAKHDCRTAGDAVVKIEEIATASPGVFVDVYQYVHSQRRRPSGDENVSIEA